MLVMPAHIMMFGERIFWMLDVLHWNMPLNKTGKCNLYSGQYFEILLRTQKTDKLYRKKNEMI